MAKFGPHGNSRLSAFLRKRILELRPRKTQVEIAGEAGFTSVNMLSMFKSGAAKLPLDRVSSLARALEADPRYLFLLTLEADSKTTTSREISEIFGTITTVNEVAWLEAVREASDFSDPPLTKRARTLIRGHFGK